MSRAGSKLRREGMIGMVDGKLDLLSRREN
jgi:hypothetical protein